MLVFGAHLYASGPWGLAGKTEVFSISRRNASWAALRTLLGASGPLLDGLGRLLGASWALLGASLAPLGPLGCMLGPQGSIWGPFWALKARFGVDFGGVWGGSGEDLGGSWEDFDQILDGFWTDMGKEMNDTTNFIENADLYFALRKICLKHLSLRTPALSREAPRSVTI